MVKTYECENSNGIVYACGNELKVTIGTLGPNTEGFGDPTIDPNTGKPNPLANIVQLHAYITVPEYTDCHILVVELVSFDKNGVEQKPTLLAAPILKKVIMYGDNPIITQDAIGTIEIINVLTEVLMNFKPLPLYLEITKWENALIEYITAALTSDCTEDARAKGDI